MTNQERKTGLKLEPSLNDVVTIQMTRGDMILIRDELDLQQSEYKRIGVDASPVHGGIMRRAAIKFGNLARMMTPVREEPDIKVIPHDILLFMEKLLMDVEKHARERSGSMMSHGTGSGVEMQKQIDREEMAIAAKAWLVGKQQ